MFRDVSSDLDSTSGITDDYTAKPPTVAADGGF